MSKVIAIVGFGPGVSIAVAERFGAEGFSVALIARSPASLAAGVAALKAQGIAAAAFVADAGDAAALRRAIAKVHAELGSIDVLHWNVYGGQGLGDLLTVDPTSVHVSFDLAVAGLLTAVQAALPDLKAAKDGALLVTNGAYGEIGATFDAYALASKAEGVALGNAAKAKLVGLLAARLKGEGVYVGEVTIGGTVGPAPMIPTQRVAETFWRLYADRDETRARVG